MKQAKSTRGVIVFGLERESFGQKYIQFNRRRIGYLPTYSIAFKHKHNHDSQGSRVQSQVKITGPYGEHRIGTRDDVTNFCEDDKAQTAFVTTEVRDMKATQRRFVVVRNIK